MQDRSCYQEIEPIGELYQAENNNEGKAKDDQLDTIDKYTHSGQEIYLIFRGSIPSQHKYISGKPLQQQDKSKKT